MDNVKTVSGIGVFANGTLTGTTATINMSGCPIPCTITLNSSNGSRAIALASDVAGNLFSPVLDANTTNMINVSVLSPVYSVTFTGAIGDTWSIR